MQLDQGLSSSAGSDLDEYNEHSCCALRSRYYYSLDRSLRRSSFGTSLPFNPVAIEEVILFLSDSFDFRVALSEIVVISLRNIWEDVKSKLSDLLKIVSKFVVKLGLRSYQAADNFFTIHKAEGSRLAKTILKVASQTLKKSVKSSFVE